MYDLHGTELNFVHRRFIGAATGFFSGGPAGAVGGFLGGGGEGRRKRRLVGTPVVSRPTWVSHADCSARPGDHSYNTGTGVCTPTRPAPGPIAAIERFLPGGRTGMELVPGGEAVMGQYGAGMMPDQVPSVRMDCTFGGTVRGLILGDDNLCYNKSQIANKERKWPVGRRPLLTGGEMRAISIASRAAGRLSRTTKRLESIGMLKKKKGGGYA